MPIAYTTALRLEGVEEYASPADLLAATGEIAKPFDPNFRVGPKTWRRLADGDSPEEMLVYRAFKGFDANLRPILKNFFLTPKEAATLNIPPSGPNTTNTPGADKPYCPLPLRELKDDEVLRPNVNPIGLPMVWTAAELAVQDTAFTTAHVAMLQRIDAGVVELVAAIKRLAAKFGL